LGNICGKHARKIKNNTPLGEIFDHGLDNILTTFQTLTIALTIGINNKKMLWYLVQTVSIFSLS